MKEKEIPTPHELEWGTDPGCTDPGYLLSDEQVSQLKSISPAPKPFPFYPTQPSEREMLRMELMMELNKWDNNDPDLARRAAETLKYQLKKQFDLNTRWINQPTLPISFGCYETDERKPSNHNPKGNV
jgi:hypothetical protein